MKKLLYSTMLVIGFCVTNTAVKAQVGIGTSNPNPNAVLELVDTARGVLLPRITLSKRDEMILPPDGLIVYITDGTSPGLYIRKSNEWQQLVDSATLQQSLDLTWKRNGDHIYSANPNNVGIGIQNPVNALQVSRGGGLTVNKDIFFPADTVGMSGVGIRMFWAPSKLAFRAGEVTAYRPTFWDNDSVGYGSVAFGSDAMVRGSYSTSFGIFNEVDGHHNFANGNNNVIGRNALWSQGNFVHGLNNNVVTSYNAVFGSSNDILAMGGNGYNLISGVSNRVEGEQSYLLGSNNIARGALNYSLGSHNVLKTTGLVVAGSSNDTTAFTQSYGGPLFQVANEGQGVRTTNMMVTTTGNVGIHVHEPLARLHVDGPIIIGDNQGSYALRAGMIRYNTALGVLQYTSGAPNYQWATLATQGNGLGGGSANGWGKTGDTVSASDFIGSVNTMPLIIKTDNQERMKVDDNGFIGINVSTPNSRLHVKSANLQLRLESTGAGANAGMVLAPNGANQWNVVANTSFTAPYGTYKVENTLGGGSMVMDGTGKVGIGTATPAYPLHIKSAANQLMLESTTAGDPSTILFKDATNIGFWQMSGYNYGNAPYGLFRISHSFSGGSLAMTNDGKVGVNTNTPEAWMDIKGTSSTVPQLRLLDDGGGYGKIRMTSAGVTSRNWDIAGFLSSGNPSFDLFKITNGSTDMMTINGNGQMGINTNAPAAALDVQGFSSSAPILKVHDQGGFNSRVRMTNYLSTRNWEMTGTLTTGANNTDKFKFTHSVAGEVMTLNGAGNVGIGVTNPTTKLQVDGTTELLNGSVLSMYKTGGLKTVQINPAETTNEGAQIALYNNTGLKTIDIDADWGPNRRGRIILDEIQIKGGSDFAEDFTMAESATDKPLPGMLVSIDEEHEGQLSVTAEAYDAKIAGVISGANGISAGMRMGQKGTIANGDMPVALAGRVYILTTEEGGEIKPGDLITSSSTKGYAMKVADRSKAQGATIGKAMTRRDAKTGYVLVLINLQ